MTHLGGGLAPPCLYFFALEMVLTTHWLYRKQVGCDVIGHVYHQETTSQVV